MNLFFKKKLVLIVLGEEWVRERENGQEEGWTLKGMDYGDVTGEGMMCENIRQLGEHFQQQKEVWPLIWTTKGEGLLRKMSMI